MERWRGAHTGVACAVRARTRPANAVDIHAGIIAAVSAGFGRVVRTGPGAAAVGPAVGGRGDDEGDEERLEHGGCRGGWIRQQSTVSASITCTRIRIERQTYTRPRRQCVHPCWWRHSRLSLPGIRPLPVAWTLRGRPSRSQTEFTTRAQHSSTLVSLAGAGRTGMAPVPPHTRPTASRHLQPYHPHRSHPRRHLRRATAL